VIRSSATTDDADGYKCTGIENWADLSTITGNTVELCGGSGIVVGATGCTCSGNQSRLNGQGGTGYAGITVNSQGDETTVTGNVCNDIQTTKTQSYGIDIQSGCDRCNVVGNMLYPILTTALNDNGSNTGNTGNITA